MSDVTPELVEQMKARDARYRVLDDAIVIAEELRTCRALQIVLERSQAEADEAILALARVNPANTDRIIELQSIWYRASFIRATLNTVLDAGSRAQESLMEDGPQEVSE